MGVLGFCLERGVQLAEPQNPHPFWRFDHYNLPQHRCNRLWTNLYFFDKNFFAYNIYRPQDDSEDVLGITGLSGVSDIVAEALADVDTKDLGISVDTRHKLQAK